MNFNNRVLIKYKLNKIKTAIILGFFLLLLSNPLHAQDLINFSHLSIQDGLSNRNVLSVFQDHYGFMWFGTNDGLNRYDGEKITVYKNDPLDTNSISSNIVISIYEGKDGELWICTLNGLNLYNRDNENFEVFKINPEAANDLTSNAIVMVTEDSKGNLYAATVMDGIQKFDREKKGLIPVVRDTSDNTGFDIVISMFINEEDNFWYFHTDPRGEIQELRFLNTETGEAKAYKVPYIERNRVIGDLRGIGVSCGLVDSEGNVWLGTADGHLMNFDPEEGFFNKIEIDKGYLFISIIEGDSSNFWIATFGNGLIKYNYKTGKKIQYKHDISDDYSISHDYLLSINKDRTGIIWIGTAVGVDRFDPYKTPFLIYEHDENDQNSLSNNQVLSIIESTEDPDLILIGTLNGLNILSQKDGSIKRFNKIFTEENDDYKIRNLLNAGNDKYWIATLGHGLDLFDMKTGKFKTVLTEPEISNTIRDIVKTEEGILWLGTTNGLVRYDPVKKETGKFFHLDTSYTQEVFKDLTKLRNSKRELGAIENVGNLADTILNVRINTQTQALVVVTGENGMSNFRSTELFDYGWIENENGEKVWEIDKEKSMHAGGALKNRIVADVIDLVPGNYSLRYISDDSHSAELWNAGPPNNEEDWGIQLYYLTADEVTSFRSSLLEKDYGNSPPSNNVNALYLDSKGHLWVGSSGSGFSIYNLQKDHFTLYRNDPHNKNSLIDDKITAFYEDNEGLIWITTQGGLNSFEQSTGKFNSYTDEDGLPTNFISDIIQDLSGTYWVTTVKGISRFNPAKGGNPTTIINYGMSDGLKGNEFYAHSKCRTSSGEIILGGKNGMISFYPGNINPYPPEIIITDFELFNESIQPGESGSPLNNSIYATKKIILNHEQNVFGFEFQAMHFSSRNKNVYSYKMEGVDKTWRTGDRNYATYTSIEPGEYTFIVKAANSDGVWNEQGRSISIIVLPPWWSTWWAYIVYALLMVLGFVSVHRFQKHKIEKREREKAIIEQAELRAKIAEAENERKSKELEEARQLQLSMLPKELPNLPHLDIAVHMKTATEVGGDYYDFHVAMDGTLTVVIGDATGHGLKAGTMVTAAKSLFNSYVNNDDILFTFSEFTRVIKEMKMHTMSMCLSLLKIKGNQLEMSSAGMPHALLFRNDRKIIEEIALKGMPLGAVVDFPYQTQSTELFVGDTLLLLSDGLPELFNKDKDMFGYERITEEYEKIAEQTPEEIIEHMKNAGSAWVGDAEPDDDVTFVVLKMK
jgi:serine phosphatase RsbU (regulator of sigma subunit)/ligand-binding sensor domain-containing protein